MKKILFVLLLTVFSVLAFCENNMPNPKWYNSLKPKGTEIKLNLNDCVIVVPANPNKKEIKAYEDLSFYLNKMNGKNIPVIKDTEYKGENFISVGNTGLFRMSPYSELKLEKEEYGIEGTGKGLYLFGGEQRGPMYAVYSLLEEDNGFRFWSQNRDEDYIPKGNILVFTPREYKPFFDTRDPYIVQSRDVEFALRNKTNSFNDNPKDENEKKTSWPNTKTSFIVPEELGSAFNSWPGLAHTSFYFVSKDNFDEHPEWFGIYEGNRRPYQLCWSNKEVLDNIVIKIKSIIKENGITGFHISPMDGYALCECEECKKLDDKEGTKAAALITGLNYILEKVQEEYPNTKISTLAYLDYNKPPKTVVPHKDLTIVCCSSDHDWNYPLCTIDETEYFRNNLLNWINYGIKTQVWTYVANYGNYLTPTPNILITAKNNKILKNMGVDGIFMEGNYETNSICDSGQIKAWVWAKLLWNPDLNPETLMKDFIYGYYGESAEPIYKYEKSLLDLYKKTHIKYHKEKGKNYYSFDPGSKLFTDKWINDSMKLMDEAVSLAKSDNMKDRVKFERISPLYMMLCRNVGFRDWAGWHNNLNMNTSQEKKEYYKSLVKEMEDLYKELDCDVVQEIKPQYGTLNFYLDRWKYALSVDYSRFKKEQIESLGWKFVLDEKGEGFNKGFYNLDYDTSSWKDVDLGVSLNTYGISNYYGGYWYKKKINVSKDLINKNFVYFYAKYIIEESFIYINGKKVFERSVASTGKSAPDFSFNTIFFNIKDYLHEGENDITIFGNLPDGYVGGVSKIDFISCDDETENDKYICELL